jgi:hypothetical protein
MQGPDIQKVVGSWKRFNFDGKSQMVTEHLQRIQEYDELTKKKRGVLVLKTKDFVKLTEQEKLEHLGPLVKEYQGKTKRRTVVFFLPLIKVFPRSC